MKPNQPANSGVHEDATPLRQESINNEESRTNAVLARPVDGHNQLGVATSPELMPEQRDTQPTSQRKIEANRRNARKSTGPKTAEGKHTVSRNALKHGIFSKNLLTCDADGREDPRDYLQMHAALCEHYRPEGDIEKLLLDRIAALTWRLSRVLRCERGQIDRALANHRFQVQQERALSLHTPELAASHDSAQDHLVDDLFLPSNGELHKLLTYEDAISKQRDRAIWELETLQRRRPSIGKS